MGEISSLSMTYIDKKLQKNEIENPEILIFLAQANYLGSNGELMRY